MKVNIKNVGVVKDITFDLDKKLTICTGQNNTGKTLSIYALYGFLNLESNLEGFKHGISFETNSKPDNLIEVIISDNMKDAAKNYSNFFEKIYKESIFEIFSSDSMNECDIQIFIQDIEKSLHDIINNSEFFGNYKINDVDGAIINKMVNDQKLTIRPDYIKLNSSGEKRAPTNLEPYIKHIVNAVLTRLVCFEMVPSSFLLPAERTAIPLFSKDVYNSSYFLVTKLKNQVRLFSKQLVEEKILDKKFSLYPKPISDFIVFLENLKHIKKHKGKFATFANELETEILQGRISVNKDGEILYKQNNKKLKNLKIHEVSSSIKSLGTLVLFLRHVAKGNETIILDEPELNLHPANQILLARFIVKLINSGFKVIISTHSDFIIREFNYLINLNSVKDNTALLEEFNMKPEQCLDYSIVSVKSFEKENVVEYEITEDGFDVDNFNVVIRAQNKKYLKLLNVLEDIKHKND